MVVLGEAERLEHIQAVPDGYGCVVDHSSAIRPNKFGGPDVEGDGNIVGCGNDVATNHYRKTYLCRVPAAHGKIEKTHGTPFAV
jgi:hypothetical protein